MKKITTLSIILFLFFGITIYAQDDTYSSNSPTAKGTLLVGASSSLAYANTKQKTKLDGDDLPGESNGNTFSLDPSVGFFADDNLAVGGQVNLSLFSSEGFNSTTIIVSPFVRYYFLEGNIRPFIEASAGIGSQTFKNDGFLEEGKSTDSLSSYGFEGGVAFFINNRVSVDLGLGYTSVNSKDKESDIEIKRISNAIGFTAGFNLFF